MALHHKLYRRIISLKELILSKLRILNYKLKYPSLSIDFKSNILENCQIVCVDGSRVIINNCTISQGVFIFVETNSTLIISNSYIGPNTVIVSKKYIEIQQNCSIAEMVVIRDQNHDYGNGKLIKNSVDISEPIIIEENVWIGAKATILKGVTIGKNSVVGANSLVNKSIIENSVVGGIPAKNIIKK